MLLVSHWIRPLIQNGDGTIRGGAIFEEPMHLNLLNSFLFLLEPVIDWRFCHQVVLFSDELFKILLICEHLNIIEPTAYLEVSKSVDIDANEDWYESEHPQCQEEHVVWKHYYEQCKHHIIVFLYLLLHEEHSTK